MPAVYHRDEPFLYHICICILVASCPCHAKQCAMQQCKPTVPPWRTAGWPIPDTKSNGTELFEEVTFYVITETPPGCSFR